MRRRSLILGSAAALAAPMLARAQAAPTKLNFRLDWKPGAQHAPFYLAKARGHYTAEGTDLSIIPGSGSADAIKQLGARAIELALIDALVMVQGAEQGVPVKAIGAYYQRAPIVLMSPTAKPVTNLKQLLSGVKLGSKKGSSTYQGLMALLGANKITPEQVRLIDVGFGVQPLLVGQVDAMMGFAMNEPIEAQRAGMEITEMPIAEHGVDVYGLTLATNNQMLSSRAALVTGFVRATRKAMVETVAEPDAALKALGEALPDADLAHERQVLDRTIPYWRDANNNMATQTVAGWQRTIDTAKSLGLVEAAPATSAIVAAEFARS